MKKSIKKLAVIVIVLTFFAMLFSCGNKEQTGTNKGNSKIEFTPEYAQKVLDREIFFAKKEFLNIYNSQINGIDKLISYKENWTFRKILNTENFVGIKWSISYPRSFRTSPGNHLPDYLQNSQHSWRQHQCTHCTFVNLYHCLHNILTGNRGRRVHHQGPDIHHNPRAGKDSSSKDRP